MPDIHHPSENPLASSETSVTNRSRLDDFTVDGLTPNRVVSPATAEECAEFLHYAASEQVGVIPQGSRTKIHIGNIATQYDCALTTRSLNRLIEFDHENLTVTAQSGTSFAELQAILAEKQQFVPLDPPSADRATLGGIIAANSSGPCRLLWKSPRDLILGMEVALPNGEVIQLGGKVVKNVAGYDLCKLFIGSYGTLGVITSLTARLQSFPEAEQTIWGTIADHATARKAIDRLLDSFLIPTAVVYLNATAAAQWGLPTLPIVLAFYEGITAAVRREVEETRKVLSENGSQTIEVVGEGHQKSLWKQVRDFPAPGEHERDPEITTVILKCTVPIAQVNELIGKLEDIAAESEMRLDAVGYAGSGIVWVRVIRNLANAVSSIVRFVDRARAVTRRLEGYLVVEFAPRGFKELQDVWGEARADFSLMQRIKARLDPSSSMSPGRWLGRL